MRCFRRLLKLETGLTGLARSNFGPPEVASVAKKFARKKTFRIWEKFSKLDFPLQRLLRMRLAPQLHILNEEPSLPSGDTGPG